MIYELRTASSSYSKENKEKLEKYGFIFRTKPDRTPQGTLKYRKKENKNWQRDGIYTYGHIEINTLEELQAFVKEWGKVIVEENAIIIYDSWIE